MVNAMGKLAEAYVYVSGFGILGRAAQVPVPKDPGGGREAEGCPN